MAFTIEDGSGVDEANAYVTETELENYADDRSVTLSDGDESAAIVRASAALDAMYRGRFPGYRTNGRNQGLEWPRTAAYDSEWLPIANDEIPIEVKNAVCEMAIRELASPGSLLPDLERGGQIRHIQAGSVGIEYGANAQAVTTFQLIDGIMARLLGPTTASFIGYASRG